MQSIAENLVKRTTRITSDDDERMIFLQTASDGGAGSGRTPLVAAAQSCGWVLGIWVC